jgi:three-Cys-motif partner protein
MDNKKLYWSANGSELPEIEPHTKAKHGILEKYLERYLVTLCGNNIGKRKTITIIDGFCGGGMYLDPDDNNALWAGSPIRIIKTVDKALDIVRREKAKPDYQLDTKFIFIDNKKRHINCLKIQLEQSGLGHYLKEPEKCKFITGEFEKYVDECINEIRQRRGSSFFFLDPNGWSDVSMDSIRRIISLRKSEILYTYMIEDVIRFLSEKDNIKAYKNVLEVERYYELINLYSSGSLAKHRYIKDETLRLFRERGQAPCVYSFALLKNQTKPKYYLIHLASNPPAQREIKYTLWEHNTIDLVYQFEYGIYGLGFRTPDYYEQNQSVINITKDNETKCINNLNDDLMPIIYDYPDGISLDLLHTLTMQKNPATLDHYIQYINDQVGGQELEVFRDGKITTAKKLKPGDFIIRKKYKQLHFMNKLFRNM